MTFERLGLSSEILRAIEDQGYTDPTPIQAQAIPSILDGKDIMGGAQTGTGKTAAFILPVLHKLANKSTKGLNTLVICPTRELAIQIEQEIQGFITVIR